MPTMQKPRKQLLKKVANAAASYKSDTADDIDNLKRRLAMYEGLFEEIERFTDLLDERHWESFRELFYTIQQHVREHVASGSP